MFVGDIAHARITRGCQNQEISIMERTVIVVLDRSEKRKRNRRVSFSGGKDELLSATKSVFSDVLSADDDLFFQIKDENSGMFVELFDEEIDDGAVLEAIVEKKVPASDSSHIIPTAPTSEASATSESERRSNVQLRLGTSSGQLSLTVPPQPIFDSPVLQEDHQMKREQIRAESQIYKKETTRPLSEYQKRINKAAEEICLENPGLLRKRSVLLEAARNRIIEEGFQFKKGKSRSKKLTSSEPQPKRVKISQDVRETRMKNIEEDIGDISDRIKFKEKRRSVAEGIRDYKKCDEVTEEISQLKHKKRELEEELKQLKVKDRQSKWYRKRVESRQSHTSTTENTLSDTDNNSSRSSTPLPRSDSSIPPRDQSPQQSPPVKEQGSHDPELANDVVEVSDNNASPSESPAHSPIAPVSSHDNSSPSSSAGDVPLSQRQPSAVICTMEGEYHCYEDVDVSDDTSCGEKDF